MRFNRGDRVYVKSKDKTGKITEIEIIELNAKTLKISYIYKILFDDKDEFGLDEVFFTEEDDLILVGVCKLHDIKARKLASKEQVQIDFLVEIVEMLLKEVKFLHDEVKSISDMMDEDGYDMRSWKFDDEYIIELINKIKESEE